MFSSPGIRHLSRGVTVPGPLAQTDLTTLPGNAKNSFRETVHPPCVRSPGVLTKDVVRNMQWAGNWAGASMIYLGYQLVWAYREMTEEERQGGIHFFALSTERGYDMEPKLLRGEFDLSNTRFYDSPADGGWGLSCRTFGRYAEGTDHFGQAPGSCVPMTPLRLSRLPHIRREHLLVQESPLLQRSQTAGIPTLIPRRRITPRQHRVCRSPALMNRRADPPTQKHQNRSVDWVTGTPAGYRCVSPGLLGYPDRCCRSRPTAGVSVSLAGDALEMALVTCRRGNPQELVHHADHGGHREWDLGPIRTVSNATGWCNPLCIGLLG